MSFIECLPREITGEIFKYLPLKDAAHCEQLCKLTQEIILKQDSPLTQGKDLMARIKMCDNFLSGQSQLKKIERSAWDVIAGLGIMAVVTTWCPINHLISHIPYVNWIDNHCKPIPEYSYELLYVPIGIFLGTMCTLTAAKTAKLFIINQDEINKIWDIRCSLKRKFLGLIEKDLDLL